MTHIKRINEMFNDDVIELNGKYVKNGSRANFLEIDYGITVNFENSDKMDFLECEPSDMWEIISTISGCRFTGENEIKLDGTIENNQVSLYADEYDVAVSLYYDRSKNGIFVKWHNNRDGSVSETNLLDWVDAVDDNIESYVWDILISADRKVYKR